MDTYFNPYEIYEGDKPFIFISYAHEDSHIVIPIVESLQKEGFRVWYDEAIELGSEWPEYIAEHLAICSCCLAFITKNSLESINCRQEINFAITHDRNPVAIYLEEVQLTPGMELRLGSIKAMYYTKFKDHEKFLYKLRTAKLLQPCLGPKPRLPVSPDTKISREAVQTITFLNQLSNSPKASWDVSKHWGSKTICWAYESDGLYDVFLAADGGVIAPENGTDLFKDCSALKQIDFSGFVPAKFTSTMSMFKGCTALESLDINNWDLSRTTDISFMFFGCKSLRTLDVSRWNTSKVTNMCSTFYDCTSLQTLDLTNWNTSKVKNMKTMFRNCKSLTALDVNCFNTSNVTDMYAMFYSCEQLKRLSLKNWNTTKITDMTWMFGKCYALTELDLGNWDTSKVSTLFSTFFDCTSLTHLDVSHWDTSKVTDMNSTFRNCSSLTALDLSSFNTSKVTTMYAMFFGCEALHSLDVSCFDTSHVTDMSYMFGKCGKLTEFDISHFDTSAATKHSYFMDSNRQINGAPWERLFA